MYVYVCGCVCGCGCGCGCGVIERWVFFSLLFCFSFAFFMLKKRIVSKPSFLKEIKKQAFIDFIEFIEFEFVLL